MFGNNGRIMRVNLSTEEIRVESLDEAFFRSYLGGNGLAAKLIHDSVGEGADPFGPENAIVFSVGPLTDTPVWGTSRGHVAAISPLTGLYADSNYGGRFATAQKRAGFDAVFVTGRSPEPVYLKVTEEGGEIKPASDLWGKTTEDTIMELEQREGDGSVCAAIGPAGENAVLFANIIAGGKRQGAAGRGGMGAVMGSKNLKAVTANGKKRPDIADREALKEFLKERYSELKRNTKPLSVFGTPVLVNVINGQGLLGTRNNSRETFEHAHDISGELIKENFWIEDTACYGCPVACGKNVRVNGGEYAGKSVKMPEYETLYALGSMMENRDIGSILNANHMCDLMGVDTITMGVTLSFVAECMAEGVVSAKDLGQAVSFQDGEALVELIGKTSRKEGIGEKLSMGSSRLAREFGKGAEKYLYAVKGMEIAGHSARGLKGMSLAYPTATRGGSHHDARPNYAQGDAGFDAQPEYVARNQCFTAVGDSLIMCRFVAERGIGTPLNDHMVTIVNLVTGWELDLDELERIGERIYNLERVLNVKRGVDRSADALPYRVMNEPIPQGPAEGRHCPKGELDAMLDAYYERRGWDREGIPTKEKLSELGLA